MKIIDKFDLTDNLALITGGTGLLGCMHCESLLQSGAKVIAVDINPSTSESEKLVNKYKNSFKIYQCDISNEKDIVELKNKIYSDYKQYPTILINNAAIDHKSQKKDLHNFSRLENFDLDQWNIEISVGLTGAMLCSKYFGTEMANQKKGVILNISSDLGLIAPNQDLYDSPDNNHVKPVTYSVIKHGIIGLTRYISTYWAKQGVRCNALAPGGIYNNHSDEFVSKLSKLIPMGRMAASEEYQATVLYMCSDASSYMNGAIISVDGGRTSW